MSGGESEGGYIEVNSGFFALAIFLYFFDTQVVIDGAAQAVPWGTHTFPIHPGPHQVRVSFKYFGSQMGANTVDVMVPPGQQVSVRYRAPWLVFLKGKITVTGPTRAPGAGGALAPGAAGPAASSPAPGWFADPSARHEHRYWDGQAWTAQVADQGTSSTDPH